jgi:hypothetical protein
MYSKEKYASRNELYEKEKLKTAAANIYYSGVLTLFTNFLWTKADTRLSLFLGFGLIYLTIKEPLLISIILSISLFFYCLNRIIQLIPWLHKIVNAKISFWHIAGLIIALTATLTIFELPAHAIFLSGLEEFLAGIAEESSVGGASTISPEAITLVFNAIRGVFLLLVGVAALFAYNQAQQGNDWRPIATQAGLAIGIILTIDVITFLFIGDGTGTAGGG